LTATQGCRAIIIFFVFEIIVTVIQIRRESSNVPVGVKEGALARQADHALDRVVAEVEELDVAHRLEHVLQVHVLQVVGVEAELVDEQEAFVVVVEEVGVALVVPAVEAYRVVVHVVVVVDGIFLFEKGRGVELVWFGRDS